MKRKMLTIFTIMSIIVTLGMGSSALANNSNPYSEESNTVAQESSVNTVAEESPDSEVFSANEAKELKFRKTFGLETNLDIVKEKIKKYEASPNYGVHLSPDEELELDKRFQFQESTIPKIKEKLKEKTNGEYTIYIDQENGGIVNIGLKDPSIDVQDITSLFPDKSKLVINKAEKSEKDLDDIHKKIWDSKEDLSKEGIDVNDVTTDIINQKIIVGVINLTEQKKNKLVSIYGGDVIEVREADLATTDADRSSTWNPMQGGAKITYPKDGKIYRCSVGFMVWDGLNKYVVTSGHCRPTISTQFNQGTTNLGIMPFKNQGGNSDAGMIGGGPSSVTYQGGKIYLTATTSGKYEITQNASEDVIGEVARMSGASTDTNAIQVGTITSTNFSITVDGYNYTKLRKANYTSVGGDSGGTVFNGNKLKGINMGHTSTEAFYCHLEYVLRDLSAAAGQTISIMF